MDKGNKQPKSSLIQKNQDNYICICLYLFRKPLQLCQMSTFSCMKLMNVRKAIPWNNFLPDRCRNCWWTQMALLCNCFPAESRNNRQDSKGSPLPSLLGCAWRFLLFLPLKSYSSSCFDFSFSRLCVLVFFPVSLRKGAVHWLPSQVTALPVSWCCGLHRGCSHFCHTSP